MLDRLRYKEAARQLDDVVRLNRRDLNVWKARVWLSVMTDRQREALDQVEWLCGQMPAETTGRDQEARCREFACFAGRIIGFLEGPKQHQADQIRLADCRERISEEMPECFAEAFNLGRQEVLDRFAELTIEIDSLAAQTTSAAEELKAKKIGRLEEERDDTQNELRQMPDRRAQVRQEFREERSQLADSQRKAFGALAQAQGQAAQAAGAYYSTAANIAQLRSFGSPELKSFLSYSGVKPGWQSNATLADKLQWLKDQGHWTPFCDWFRNRRQPYVNQLTPYLYGQGAALSALNGQAAGARAHAAMLNRQYLNAAQREWYEQRLLDHIETMAGHRIRRIDSDEKRTMMRRPVGHSPELAVLRSKASALHTYIPLPVSVPGEKQRILDSYQPSVDSIVAKFAYPAE
jgi:hypothetical protein